MYILCDYQTLLSTKGYKSNFRIYINYAMNMDSQYDILSVSFLMKLVISLGPLMSW
jgi:hypothetical protein